MIKIIGTDAAVALCAKFGGASIYIPKTINILLRNQQIQEDFKTMTIAALRSKYNLSESQIRTILNMKNLTIEDFLKEEE